MWTVWLKNVTVEYFVLFLWRLSVILSILWRSFMWVTQLSCHLPPNRVERLCRSGRKGNLLSAHEYASAICALLPPFVFRWYTVLNNLIYEQSVLHERKFFCLFLLWDVVHTPLEMMIFACLSCQHCQSYRSYQTHAPHTRWNRSIFQKWCLDFFPPMSICGYSVKRFRSLVCIKPECYVSLKCQCALGFSWGQRIKRQTGSFNVERD